MGRCRHLAVSALLASPIDYEGATGALELEGTTMPLNRYLVFIGELYGESAGGWEQFRGDRETPGEAYTLVEELKQTEKAYANFCWQIVDTETRELFDYDYPS